MAENDNKNVLNLLAELATNDDLFKHYVNVRSNPAHKDVFFDPLIELGKRHNITNDIMDILLHGSEEQIKNLIRGGKGSDPLGIFIIVYLLEPVQKK